MREKLAVLPIHHAVREKSDPLDLNRRDTIDGNRPRIKSVSLDFAHELQLIRCTPTPCFRGISSVSTKVSEVNILPEELPTSFSGRCQWT